MTDPVVLAYCDPVSVKPGEPIRFMVSCEGPAPTYDCQLVRLLCCDTGPHGPGFREVPVSSDLDRSFPARSQTIDIGSYAFVENLAAGSAAGFAAQVIVWPTLLDGRPQALLGNWNDSSKRGFCLYLDANGALAFRIGDGNGQVAEVTTGVPLVQRRWGQLAVSFDAEAGEVTLVQRLLPGPPCSPVPQPVRHSVRCSVRPETTPAPFLIAAWIAGSDGRKLLTDGHFNGKIEDPQLLGRPLAAAEIEHLCAPAADPFRVDQADPALQAAWAFSVGISTDQITDQSSRRSHGVLVNMPMRAVTGHNWNGEEFDWRHAPEQYGAIHFHSDDLGDARWDPDFVFTPPAGLESGVYAARLEAPGALFHVPFVVRPAAQQDRRDVALLLSSATYTAYANCRERFLSKTSDLNQGRLTVLDDLDLLLLRRPELGLSTYDHHADGSGVAYGSRLRPVLNHRPITSDITVAYDNFAADLLIVDWLTRACPGFDVITDEDLHTEGSALLEGHRVVVTATHPEYASREMRDALDAHIASGGRLIYLGGNGLYWRIAYHPDTTGIMEVRRAEGGVRAWRSQPGEAFHSFTGEYGGMWQRCGRPPNETLGVGFIAQGFDLSAPYERTPAGNDPRARFIFEGVGHRFGEAGLLAGGAAGLELDNASLERGTPGHALTVARSVGHSNIFHLVPEANDIVNGFTDGTLHPEVRSDMVFFEAPSGGAVFSVGSIAFAGSLSANAYDNDVARLMGNVLGRFRDPAPFPMPTT